MQFQKISEIFEKLEKTSKRLEKILLLRDFLNNNPKEAPLIFDMITGNFQREIEKKTIGISLKTLFAVLNFISKISEKDIEKQFNKKGDIGTIAKDIFGEKKQRSLYQKDLDIKQITEAFKTISKTTGKDSNKIKKEILAKLFLSAKTETEYKFLARLLIDDLRIGVSDGVLKEAAVNSFFPSIIGIHLLCEKCGYINLNTAKCFKCGENIEIKKQDEIAKNTKKIIELKKEEDLKNILQSYKKTQIIKTEKNRDLYNIFLSLFEKKYNHINSFTKVIEDLEKDISSIYKSEINLGIPIRSMLGTRANSIDECFEMTKKPALLDFKYDGLRVQIHNKNGVVKLFSRNLEEITKQFPEIVHYIKDNFKDISFVIDSECVGFDFDKKRFLPFQVLSRRIMTKNITEVSHIKVVVRCFDLLYLNGKTLIDAPYKERREKMEELFLNRPLKQAMSFDKIDIK